jgi:hypothetical protein
MAARKKRPAKAARSDAAFVVVLEDLNAKFNVFGEALQGVRDEVQGVRDELHGFREDVDRRFGRVELAIRQHSREIREVRGELGEVGATVARIESALATKVDRDAIEPIVESVLARR